MEERVNATFSAWTMPSGIVQINFTPNEGCGTTRLLLAPSIGHVENDLVSTFGLREDQAKAAIVELERNGIVDVAASVDREIIPKLVIQRDAA
jgi:hypothetical protein